jgi:hypothetical protein
MTDNDYQCDNQGINEYLIHDNGGRPFKAIVNFDEKNIKVYKFDTEEVDDNSEEDDIDYNILVYETDYTNIFIGQALLNGDIYDENYYPEDDGNSILVETGDKEYTFVGSRIYSFTSFEKIQLYSSFIGNSDVPYPYAIDKKKNIYLMIENVVIIPGEKTFDYFVELKKTPYLIYYNKCDYDNNYKYEIVDFDNTILVERLFGP